MFYREAGEFKTSYVDDSQTFPIKFDRYAYYAFIAFLFLVVPFLVNDYWVNSLIVPVLIYSIAALGLNILTGYCGQLSLGTGGFMAVGAYASFKLMTSFPELNIILVILLSGVITAGVGVLFGLPSLRIKGFYLAVATLAAQFFLVWLFTRTPWFFNNSPTGMIQTPTRTFFGVPITGASTSAVTMYIVCLSFVVVLAWLARNLTRGRIGRMWKAVRDMDIAAELIGISLMRAKLLAFAISSFYIGISGALLFAVYLGAVEASEAFGIDKSFLVLFMIIIGGLGSIFGAFAGALFLIAGPVLLKLLLVNTFGWSTDLAAHLEVMIIGALIIVTLILEPHGFAAIWRTIKEKLRLWPFPY